jgi:hypothetical protein
VPFASRLGLMRSGLCCEWWLRRRLRNCSGLPPSPRLLMNSGVTFTRGSRLQTHGEHVWVAAVSHRRTALRGIQPNHLSFTTKSSQNRLLTNG